MKDRAEKAKELFKNGYNCSQSVFTAFADIYGIDEEKALKLSTPFGGGFAGKRVICGAVSAMTMIVGLEEGSAAPHDKGGRDSNYDKANVLMEQFKTKYGSLLCKHLKGLEPCEPPIKRVDCSECVHYCAHLIEENLLKKNS
jgi:C_GCAxxG_C_C family probable redox protein